MWPFGRKTFPVSFTNTLSGKKEAFVPKNSGRVLMYSCGPTVYGPQHIGNLRAAVFTDLLARTLTSAGYRVNRVMNITDVGHLVGDGDEGEDKIAVGAAREQLSPETIADKYTKQYLEDVTSLNIDIDRIRFPRATNYIGEQIEMIRTLERRGHTYTLKDGVYFDTTTFPAYGKLGNQQNVAIEAGARVDMVEGKKHPRDFVLWRMAGPHDLQKWPSPWGEGNPGWSIECSAMAAALLGPSIDIHTGGEDHIAVHHNNEIAQSEGASGKPLSRFWIHNAFLTADGQKISKSIGNTYVLADVRARGIHPLALRYFFLQAHYSTPQSFTWDALASADETLRRLWKITDRIKKETKGAASNSEAKTAFFTAMRDDLGAPQALAILWDTLTTDGVDPRAAWGLIIAAEAAFGLCLTEVPAEALPIPLTELPDEVRTMLQERATARDGRDYARSDELRLHIERSGYRVEDSASGTIVTKKPR